MKQQHRLGELIAHWNLEHTDEERKAHLDWARGFLKSTGLDKFMTAQMKKPSEMWCLGWPKTRIDLKLRKRYRNRTYRRFDGSRIVGLSAFHLTFAHQAGVYEFDKHTEEVHAQTWSCKGPEDAARISAWGGWEDTCCDYTLRTDARHYGYRCRHYSGYDGSSGDSFHYGPDWDYVHGYLADVIYRIVGELGIRQVK